MGSVTPADLGDLPTGRPLEIELALPGYRVRKETITLFPDQGVRELSVNLEKQAGGLLVRTEPDGAHVSVDGKKLGRSPQSIEGLAAGKPVTVRATKKGYKSASTIVVVPDGEVREVLLQLAIDQMSIPPGRISIKTSPSGCAVYLDGEPAGTSPVVITKRAGSYEIKVECENYGSEHRAVIVDSGRTADVSFAMRPTVFGYLTIRPIPAEGTVISINGRRVPSPVEFLKVIPGHHDVLLENRSLNLRKTVSIDVAPNARISRNVNLVGG